MILAVAKVQARIDEDRRVRALPNGPFPLDTANRQVKCDYKTFDAHQIGLTITRTTIAINTNVGNSLTTRKNRGE